MWIKEPGIVTERIEFLGKPELCSYLVKGDIYALIGGAMAQVTPDVLAQLNDLTVDLERIRYLILLHTHYDHVGMAPYLAEQWPWLKVAASRVGSQVLKNERALKAIQDYNNSRLQAENLCGQMEPLNLVEKGFPVHHVLNGGTELNLNKKLKLFAIDVPGHSVCSMALYVPGEYALFPSDSIGTLAEKRILPFGSSNYDDFQESIERLSRIGAEIVCLEHFGALTPPEGKDFCGRAKKEARDFRKKMVAIYREKGDTELTVDEIAEDFDCGLSKAGLLPENLLRDILRRIVVFINQTG